MPADPFVLFAAAPEFRRNILKSSWPELHDCLARLDGPAPQVRCASIRHRALPGDQRPVAVARIVLNGAPACAPCLRTDAKRPGGYPLALTDPRNVK